jgi:hypothetical protein
MGAHTHDGGAHDGGAHAGAPLQGVGGTHDGGAHDGGAHAGAPLQGVGGAHGAPDVGADLRVCPDSGSAHDVGADLRVCPNTRVCPDSGGAHAGAPLPTIVQWFKTMTTNEYIRMVKHAGWTPFQGRLWQRNYYEHIIRNERALERIRDYILTNPLHWHLDRENTHAIGINSLEEEWFG